MHRGWCVLLACALVGQTQGFTFTEFCPDPSDKGDMAEYFVLAGSGPLDSVSISDGEGTLHFPSGAKADERLCVAGSAVSYHVLHGMNPDFEWTPSDPSVPDVIRTGPFRMANDHDSLVLYEGGRETDRVSWPAEVRSRTRQIHFRSAGAWDPRVLLEGQSRFVPATFEGATVIVGPAPDSSTRIFNDAIAEAQKEIDVNVYEFTSPSMAGAMARARERGINVTVLVEGGPVGGIGSPEKSVINRLWSRGVPVYEMGPAGEGSAPYRYDHAKYLVIDDSGVFISSENFGANGFPDGQYSGNRGWVASVWHPGVAGYFKQVFLTDLHGPAVSRILGIDGAPEEPMTPPYDPEFIPERFENVRVTPVIAPDTSYLLEKRLKTAEKSIDIEQAYITNETDGGWNRYLAAAINASRRGVTVRVLLDSYWFNVADEADNDEMADAINRLSETEHISISARCADLDGNGLVKIHNKGVIIDGSTVLVSSINWNTNSPTFNREAGVFLDSPGVGAYFTRVFLDDWEAGGINTQEYLQTREFRLFLAGIILLVLAAGYCIARYRRIRYY